MSKSADPAPPVTPSPRSNPAQVAGAWGVHAFTMSGVVWACLALVALVRGDVLAMWGWLGIALVVDGLDGTLARRAEVKRHVPWFDGSVLDLIVDYLTWTFIPALFMYLHLPLGPGALPMVLMVVVCATSMFCYCNTQMKSSDHYFVGFPAAWNVTAVHMWVMQTPAWLNVVVTVVLAVLTVVPLVFLHPFRVRTLMPVNIAAVAVWIATTGYLLVHRPERPVAVYAAFLAAGLWIMGISAWRTVRGRAGGRTPAVS